MANPSGYNAFPGFVAGVPYGAKKKQGDLQRMAPAAGQQNAARALNAPRRAQTTATANPAAPAAQTEPLAPGAAPADLFAQISAIPGVTPIWSELV